MANMNRRAVVTGTSVLVSPIGAGCLGGNELNTDTETESDSEPNQSPENSTSGSAADQSPIETVRSYLEAINDSNIEAARAAVHPDGPLTVDESALADTTLTIDTLETRTVRDVVSYQTGIESGDELDNATAERQAQLDELTNEMDFEATAYVFFSVTYESGSDTGHFLVVKAAEWQIWS